MRSFCALGLAIVGLSLFGCDRPALHPVPFHDLSTINRPLPDLLAWKANPSGPFDLFRVKAKGAWVSAAKFGVIPVHDFSKIGQQLFYPTTATMVNGIQTTEEILSSNGNYAISMDGVKTFADDLDNARIVVRQVKNGRVERITVPALCNGEMFPLFWLPNGHFFYFVVSVGDERGRSLQLWEYDLAAQKFINVGDTNGDVHLSKDGTWVIWETGPTVSGRIGLCAYDTIQKFNYRLNPESTMAFFQGWEGSKN